jgi:type II secretory pathway pseudopilin PulG
VTGRDRIVVMVVAAVALLGAFFFLAVSPKRAELKAVDSKIATAQQRLDAARSSVATAQQAKRDYDTDYAAVARLGKAVPLDDNVPSLIYQLQSASQSSKVDFRSLKLESSGSSAPVAPAATAAATPATAPDASKSSSSSSTPPAAATPAPATQLAAAALPPGATVGAAGFPTMPFTFIFDGSFFDMEHMLRDVNRFITVDGKSVSVRGRLLAIDGFSLEAAPSGFPAVTATLRATAYLLPADQGLTAGATATAPAAAGTTAAPAASTASTGSTPAPPTAAATGVK